MYYSEVHSHLDLPPMAFYAYASYGPYIIKRSETLNEHK
jgi:hypothetical protein